MYMRIRTLLILLFTSLVVLAEKLDHPVFYTAKDSVIMTKDGTGYLHGSGTIKYDKMELEAEYIRAKIDSSTIYAQGVLDTIEDEIKGKPVFKDGTDSYQSESMAYNLKTQKGFIRGVVSEQGEGYIIADRTKTSEGSTMDIAGGKYTTCNDHDHPHFYLKMTKAKVKPGDYIAAGPAYMVVGDVPVPLAVPFGFFPFTSKYSSGIIMPNVGDDYNRGLYMQGLGYYFALCDYADLEIKGDLYTRGTWAVQAASRYTWRYHFSGSLNLSFRSDKSGEKGMPNYSEARNFSIQWSHRQDSKANPYCNFSASVNFSTSGYNRSNINSYYNAALNSENTKSSSISYTQRFPDSPWSLTMSALVSQRTKDSTLTLTLPDLSVSMSSIAPFKRKKAIGKEKWFEKIKLSYNMNGKIAISNVKEYNFLHTDFLRDWQFGFKHNASLNASWTIAKYLNISPSITLTDRMYFRRQTKEYDPILDQLQTDTTTGFYNVFDFNASLSMSTKFYMFFIPSKKLFPQSKVDRFRLILTPSVSGGFHPDFSSDKWGYYGHYTDRNGKIVTYNRFQGQMYGNAAQGLNASISFSLAANLEVKHVNRKDTTGNNPWMVSSLIDNLSISSGYNFAADSMGWSNFAVNLRIKLPKALKNYTINLSTSLDPYMYQLNERGTPVRTNKQYWHNGKFPHWNGTSTSFSYTLNNQTFAKLKDKKKKSQSQVNLEEMTVKEDGTLTNATQNAPPTPVEDDGFTPTEIPWNLSLSYSIRYGNGPEFDYNKMRYKMILTHNLSVSGSIGLGKGWKASTSVSFDCRAKKFSATNISISRDLHCWNMSASVVPFGPYKSYTFHIGVNASMLADLKYDKNSSQSSRKRVNWL